MCITKSLFILSFVFVFLRPAWSGLEFRGNQKTSDQTLNRMIGTPNADPSLIEKKLMETGLFVSVKARQFDQRTVVEIQEKWTTIPIFKINTTGDQRQFVGGVYDPNLLGTGLELGGQYENLVGEHSGVVWYKDRFSGLGLELWQVSRLREKYDQKKSDPLLVRSFVQQQSKISVSSDLPSLNQLKTRLKFDFQKDRFSSPDSNQKPEPSQFGLAHLELHYLPYNLSFILSHAQGLTSTSHTFQSAQFEFLYSYRLTSLFEFAGRLKSGFTNAKNIQFWFYHGGLESIRGYRDNRFQGRSFWLSNQEVRAFIHQGKHVHWQSVLFTDMLSRAEKTSEFLNLDGVSAGIGLRLIVPRIYRFVLRLDYAKKWKSSDDQDWSFGAQHFFKITYLDRPFLC